MNRTQMIERIAEHTGVEKKTVNTVIAGFGDVVLASVSKGDPVMLPGIAKFTKVKRKARTGRNPATGASIKIPAKTVAKVTALKTYKDTVLGNSPAPKLQKTGVTAKPAGRSTRASSTAAAKPAAGTRSTRSSAAKAEKPATRTTRAAAGTRATKAAAATRSTSKATAKVTPARSSGRTAKATAEKAPARGRARKA